MPEGHGKVLLVDDEELVLEVGAAMLVELGYMVVTAKGGKEALALYREEMEHVDLVLLDLIMPDMGGGDVYDGLKGINQHVKVLLSSGYSLDSEAMSILDRGCNGFIQKPFSLDELSRKLREILMAGP
jgi:CheY-like chemotaxis protein